MLGWCWGVMKCLINKSFLELNPPHPFSCSYEGWSLPRNREYRRQPLCCKCFCCSHIRKCATRKEIAWKEQGDQNRKMRPKKLTSNGRKKRGERLEGTSCIRNMNAKPPPSGRDFDTFHHRHNSQGETDNLLVWARFISGIIGRDCVKPLDFLLKVLGLFKGWKQLNSNEFTTVLSPNREQKWGVS